LLPRPEIFAAEDNGFRLRGRSGIRRRDGSRGRFVLAGAGGKEQHRSAEVLKAAGYILNGNAPGGPIQDTYDMMVNHWYSWANRLTGTAMTRVQEMEAKARTFAVKYRNLTGSAPPGVVEPSQRPNPGNIVSGIATPIAIAAAALGGLFLVVQMSK
jgi:hypothetical protein